MAPRPTPVDATARVLCVDDEPHILRTLGANLRVRGFDVALVATGREALAAMERTPPDVVVLDLGLPDISGLEVIAETRRRGSTVPIIVLSARDQEHDKVLALDAGADDYVSKPFGMGELLARLRASLRRRGGPGAEPPSAPPAPVVTDHFSLDFAARRAVVAGAEVKLTPTEWHLVEVLVRDAGTLLTGRHLLQQVWGPQYGEETNYLRVHMAHIRRKLEREPGRPRHFRTEPGMGYRFDP